MLQSDDKNNDRDIRFRYRDILFFWKFVRPLWVLGLTSLILTAVSTALSSLLPLSVKLLIDFIVMKRPVDDIGRFLTSRHLGFLADPLMHLAGSLNYMVVTLFAVGIVIGMIGIVEKLITLRFQQEITFTVQTELFGHVLRFPLSFLKQKQVGYLMSRVSDDVGMVQFFFSWLAPQLVTNSFYSLFGIIILFNLNSTVASLLLLVLPVLFAINFFFAARLRAVSQKEMERHAMVSEEMHEAISGAEVLKAFTAEHKAVEKISEKLRKLFSSRFQGTALNALSSSFTQQTKFVLMLAVVVLGVHRIEAGAMTIGDLTTVIAYLVYLSGRLTGISSTVLSLQPVFASMERLVEMFKTVPEYGIKVEKKSLIRHDSVKKELKGELIFSGVSFSYDPGKPVLEDISFKVEPGHTLIITGESGAGKTTLVNLLLKFHYPTGGSISLDGKNLQEIDTRWLRDQIGIVSQEVFLFNDTVENNIKFGKPAASRDEVISAARQAHIHGYIDSLPQGYQTIMGERGGFFSPGQRQRISIARAFLRDPVILVLDEPSSALDMDTEKKLKDSLEQLTKERTTLIISHRMHLIDGLGTVKLEL